MYPHLNFSSARAVILPYLRANKPVLLFGSPGVGKTTLAGDIAREIDLPLVTIIASTCDPTDFGGFPVVQPDGAFDRVPMRAIRQASEAPSLLFLDELTTAPPAVQAALLRGVLDRVFGDVELHPETVIMAAANPPEQAPGGMEPAAPLMGRFAAYNFAPSLDEFKAFLAGLGSEESRLRALALDLSATLEHAAELVVMDPPPAAVNDGAKWASPRDWHRGLEAWAECEDQSDDLAHLILSGSLGEHASAGYLAIRKLREHLPSVREIVADPASAQVPDSADYQLGALGLLSEVASVDCWAAWIYAVRLREEIGAAAARALVKRSRPAASPHKSAGHRAMVKLLGRIGRGA